MDADSFGFDCTANYSDDPGMWMNSPDVKLVISLSLSQKKSNEMLALSLSLSLDSRRVENYWKAEREQQR